MEHPIKRLLLLLSSFKSIHITRNVLAIIVQLKLLSKHSSSSMKIWDRLLLLCFCKKTDYSVIKAKTSLDHLMALDYTFLTPSESIML